MDNLADVGFVDESTNTGVDGYHAQRLCSPQFWKPSFVTNYLCGSSYDNFKYSCPAFFMIKGEKMMKALEDYHKMCFVTSFKNTIPFDLLMKWQDQGQKDLKVWENWRRKLNDMESSIKSMIYINEK